MKTLRYLMVPLSAATLAAPGLVFATNGMDLEGYGPVALGMGGASMAYDNGSAAVMNNPATIGLMKDGTRADFALGFLGPNVSAKYGGMTAKSSGDAYYMPAVGWLQKQGVLGYGVGLFAQGGMGTEYKADSFMAAGSGEKVRSEVSVGRLIFPITYDVSPTVHLGGSVDYVWAGMDIKMAMSGKQFGDMVSSLGGTQSAGTASGTLVSGIAGMLTTPNPLCGGVPCLSGVNWARFDFSNTNQFTGDAKGSGFAGKIGAVFSPNEMVNIGVTYHTKTALSDLKATNAKVSMNVTGPACGGAPSCTMPVTGTIKVQDFEWPATYGAGISVKPTQGLMVAADVKVIQWAAVMKNFKMHFVADSGSANTAAGFAGADLDAVLFQKWKDQTVVELGAAYNVNPETVVRVGYNHASNPIPDTYLNALFPAIEETHVTLGVGYTISTASSIDFALSDGLSTSATAGSGVKSTMSQLNWQFMYSYRY